MTLDEIEKLAGAIVDDDTGDAHESEWQLARALLAVLPVVRAAEEWRDCEVWDRAGDMADLWGAVDAMRVRLAK